MVAMAGALIALAACGQSDGSSSEPAPPPSADESGRDAATTGDDDDGGALNRAGSGADPLTREAYVLEANRVCREATDAINALEAPASLAELGEQVPELQEIAQRELDGLLALAQPELPEERIDPEYFGLLERQMALLRALGAAAADGDLVRARDVLAQAAPLGDEAAAIATGYGIAECAGGVETEPSPAPEPSGGPDTAGAPADGFAAAADAICRESRALVAGMKAPQTLAESVTALRETIDISTAELAELRTLEPPEELAESFDGLLELRERQIALLEVLGEALAAEDRDAAAEALLESARLDAESNMIEQQLGFEVCGMEPVQEVPNLPRPLEPGSPRQQGG